MMTNFLLTLIVVLVADNQAWRMLSRDNEHPSDMHVIFWVAYFIALILILIFASGISYGLLLIFNKNLPF